MIDDFSGFSKRIFEDTIADRLKQNKTQIEKKRLDKNASRRRMDKYKEAFWRAPLVYHRTKEGAYDSINNTGYRSGGGDWWGPGIYTVFDLKSTTVKKGTENPYNDGDSYPTMYGPVIIENEVQHLDNFLILDYDVAKPVYEPRLGPGNFLLTYQLAEILPQSVYEKHRTLIESCEKRCSDLAAANPPFAYTTDVYRDIFGVKEIIAYLRGVIMTGPNDGRTLISYDEENITPVSYSLDKAKTWNEFDKKGAYETAKRRQKEILSGNLSSKELSDQISQQAKGAANSVIAKFGEATIHTTVMEAVEYYFKNFSFLIDASSALSEEERIECLPIVINALLEKGVDNKKFYNSAKLCFLSIVGVDMAEKIKEGLDLLSSAEESGEAIRLLAELNRFDKLASFDHKLASGIMKKVCAWIKSQEDRSMGILFKRFIDDVLSRISFGADSALYPLLDMLLLVESGYITKSNYANAFYAASCYRMLNAAIEGSSPDVSEIVSCLEAFGGMESADGEDGIPQLPFQEQGVLEYIKDIFGANSKIDTNPQTIYMYQCMMGLIFLKDDQLKPLEPYLGKFYEGWLLDMRRASLKVCKTNLEMQLPEKVVDSIASESLRKMAESDYILKKAIEQNKLNCSFASLSGVLANMAGGESKKYLEAAYMESISTKDLKSPFETIAGKIPQMTGLPSLDEYADPFSDGWAPSEQKDADVDSAVKSEYDMIYSILSILKKKGVSLSIDDLEESAPAGQMSEFGFSVIAGMRLDKLIQLKEAIGFFDIALKAKIAGMAGMNIGLFHSGIFLKRSVEVSRSSLENPDVLKAISEMCESPEFKYGDISIGRSSDGTSAMLSWTSIVAAKLYSDGLPEILSPIAEKIRKALSGDSAHRILNGMSSLGTEKSGEQMLRCLMALGVKKGDIDADAYHDIILDYIQKNGIDFAMTDKAGLTSNMSIIAKIQSAWKLEGAARAEKMKELSREFEPDRRFLEDYKLAKSNVYQLMEDAYYLGIKPSDVKDFYPGYFHQACETYLVALLQGGESERLSEFAEYLKSEIDSLKYDQNFSGDEKGKFGLYKIDYESMKPISDFETLKKLVSYKIVDISDAYRFKMEDSCLAEMVRSFPPSTTSDNFGKMLDRVEDKEKVCRAAIDSCAPHLAIEAFERIGKPQELLPKIAAKIGKDDIEELVKVLVYSKDKASISKSVPEEAKRELASLLPNVMKENKLNSIEDFCEFLLKEYGGQYSPEDVSALAAAIRGFMQPVKESFVMGFGAFKLKRKGII